MAGFFDKVYAVVEQIPPGNVMTYGQISDVLDNMCSARYVGYAMASAPALLGLPCHRVVNRLGEMAGGGIFGGAAAQRSLLEAEGVTFKPNGRVDLDASLYRGAIETAAKKPGRKKRKTQ
ncbi:MAG: DNA base-flipping protein [Desulfovibrio sp.]